ncbi:MAG: VCBS repeat-containing protein, partial [Planctomycetales bacterium]|nr:VCBS repeat-containing protein [Planctomycetales bacterium]
MSSPSNRKLRREPLEPRHMLAGDGLTAYEPSLGYFVPDDAAPPIRSGTPIPGGDFNGDGIDDLLILEHSVLDLHLSSAGSWEPAQSLTQVFNPRVVDFDGDGWLDVVTGSSNTAGVTLWRNQGDGSLAQVDFPAPAGAMVDFAIAHFDAGDNTGFVVLDNAGVVSEWAPDGNVYTRTATNIASGSAKRLTTIDANHDGQSDILMWYATTNAVSPALWLRVGPGEYALAPVQLPSALRISAMDADGDGHEDLAFDSATNVAFWSVDAEGDWSELGAIDFGENSYLEYADFDGDGDLDVWSRRAQIVTDGTPLASLYRNDGGVFRHESQTFRQSSGASYLVFAACGDWDGDGDADLMLRADLRPPQLWFNADYDVVVQAAEPVRRSGAVPTVEFSFLASNPSTVAAALFVDFDFAPNLSNISTLGVELTGGATTHFTATSATEFGRAVLGLPAGSSAFYRFRASIEGSGSVLPGAYVASARATASDGSLEGSEANNWSAAHLASQQATSLGSQEYVTTQTIDSASWSDVAAGDFDGDGDSDLLLLEDGTVTLWKNDRGVFRRDAAPASFPRAQYVTVGDVDGDGDVDAYFTPGLYPGAPQLWLNDGLASFSLSPSSPPFIANLGMSHLIDVDADGDLDLVHGGVGFYPPDREGGVYLNDGLGSFTSKPQPFDVGYVTATAAGDVDGDGDLDVVFGDSVSTSIWLNDGQGTYSRAFAAFEMRPTSGMALVDLDGDGSAEFVESFRDGAHRVSRLNLQTNPAQLESTTLQGSPLNTFMEVLPSDLNGDGRLDLTFGGTGDSFLSTDDGGWQTYLVAWSLASPKLALLADLDGDGALEALAANGGAVLEPAGIDIQTAINDHQATATYGQPTQYEVVVQNAGTIAAEQVDVTTSLPPALLDLELAAIAYEGGATSTATQGPVARQFADLASLPAGARIVYQFAGVYAPLESIDA